MVESKGEPSCVDLRNQHLPTLSRGLNRDLMVRIGLKAEPCEPVSSKPVCTLNRTTNRTEPLDRTVKISNCSSDIMTENQMPKSGQVAIFDGIICSAGCSLGGEVQ